MAAWEDRLELRGMRFRARHGVHPEEKERPQSWEIDVVLQADLSRPAATDELTDTVDYAAVHALVREIVEGPPVDLIETLAGRIAAAVLDATPVGLVGAVEVRLRKPQAPLPGAALETVEVTLVRRRAG
jgi:dihydroneopterin aldolase